MFWERLYAVGVLSMTHKYIFIILEKVKSQIK